MKPWKDKRYWVHAINALLTLVPVMVVYAVILARFLYVWLKPKEPKEQERLFWRGWVAPRLFLGPNMVSVAPARTAHHAACRARCS